MARALKQYQAGEYDSFGTATVPVIGWDWGVTLGTDDINKYVFQTPLVAGSFISVTLAWDREISLNDTVLANGEYDAELFQDVGPDGVENSADVGEHDGVYQVGEPYNDVNGNNVFDGPETFTTLGLTDLDLFLMPKGATNLTQHIDASFSSIDSVEHMFFQIPSNGEYEFWVRQFNAPLGDQFYGLAWWAVPEPSTLVLAVFGAAGVLVARLRRKRSG